METTAQALQSEDPFQKNKRWAIYFLSLLIFTYIESPVFIFVISRIYLLFDIVQLEFSGICFSLQRSIAREVDVRCQCQSLVKLQ